MKMKTQYAYTVDGVNVNTREAARIVQRSLRAQAAAKGQDVKAATKIVQHFTISQVVR